MKEKPKLNIFANNWDEEQSKQLHDCTNFFCHGLTWKMWICWGFTFAGASGNLYGSLLTVRSITKSGNEFYAKLNTTNAPNEKITRPRFHVIQTTRANHSQWLNDAINWRQMIWQIKISLCVWFSNLQVHCEAYWKLVLHVEMVSKTNAIKWHNDLTPSIF